MPITKSEISSLMRSVALVVREYVDSRVSGFASAERAAELSGQVNVMQLKIQELQRQCDANKRHVAHVESKVTKLRGDGVA